MSAQSRVGSERSQMVPQLRWDTVISQGQDESAIEYEDMLYTFEGLPNPTWHKILGLIDGRNRMDDIARLADVGDEVVKTVIEKLVECGVAVVIGADQPSEISVEEFSSACRRLFARWKRELFGHPLWTGLASGAAPPGQFLGWMIESYHFIEGVNVRLPMVISLCDDPVARDIFAHHYEEEYDHSDYFAESLKRYGLTGDVIATLRPLPGTLAVLNYTRDAARSDWLAYAVCSGFLESTGGDRLGARQFFEAVASNYVPTRRDVIAPMVEHLDLDEAYQHNELMEAACAHMTRLTAGRATAALGVGVGFVETLKLWSTDIVNSYADDANVRTLASPYRRRRTASR